MFKKLILACLIITSLASCSEAKKVFSSKEVPDSFLGVFSDDYNITYDITAKTWKQTPGITYKIIGWNMDSLYLIATNIDSSRKTLYTRIDFMKFKDMAPYEWGFCYTTYTATSLKEAFMTAAADRQNPKKGCGGFPFSRMKRRE